MKIFIVIIQILLATIASLGQTTTPKKSVKLYKKITPVNEIDRLCGKYKNGDSLTITNEYGTFKASVHIEYIKGKPFGIYLVGNIKGSLEPALMEFIKSRVIEKRSKGYSSSMSSTHSVEEELDNSDLSKGIIYLSEQNYAKFRVNRFAGIDPVENKWHENYTFLIANRDLYRTPVKYPNIDF